MSISRDGVHIVSRKNRRRQHIVFGFCIAGMEILLSFFLYMSLGAHILYPNPSLAATGSPNLLSYEGYLTDASGNALGGTGTPYCFRYSIYDNPTVGAGSKLWPAGTPATTMATSTDGVFSSLIGAADALTYNFYDSDSVYLNVEVNTTASTCGGTWQTLSPRQQIAASGYAISTENIYGSLLQSQTASSRVQVGSGSGTPTPIYFGLDVKSSADYIGQSCTTSGTVWYNSAISKALVCENGIIQAISNSSGTTTITALTANTGTAASTGTIVFSNGNGVTFGINGNIITASVAAAGGVTGSVYSNYLNGVATTALTTSFFQSTSVVVPFYLAQAVSGSYVRLPVTMSAVSTSFATTINTTFSASLLSTFRYVMYSLGTGASSASLQSVASGSAGMSQQWSLAANSNGSQYSVSQNISFPQRGATTNTFTTSYALSNLSFQISTGSISNFNGPRFIDLPFAASLPAGQYWMVYGVSSTTSTQGTNAFTGGRVAFSQYFASNINGAFGNLGSTTNSSVQLFRGVGSFTTAGGGTTASLALSNISSIASNAALMFQIDNNY